MYATNKPNLRVTAGLSLAAFVFAIIAFMFAVTGAGSPCAAHAQSTQCSIGDDEIISGALTLEDELNLEATPSPGSSGQFMISQGADTPPEWVGETILKPSDESTSLDTTLTPDSDFVFTLEANKTYRLHGFLLISGPITTGNFKFQFTTPAGATIDGIYDRSQLGASPERNSFSESGSEAILTSSAEEGQEFTASVQVGGTPGSLTFTWAQNESAAGSTTVHQGSWMEIRELN